MDWSLILDNTLRGLFQAEAMYLCLAVIGLNIHFGYTGLLNFGQVGFMAIGAYGTAISITYYDQPMGLAILFALVAVVVYALVLGIPTLRLRADYLAIVTIAASEVIRQVAASTKYREYTGGSSGLNGFADGFYSLSPFEEPPKKYGIGPLEYDGDRLFLLLVGWGLVLLASLLVFMLMRSPWGRVLKAIREDEDAARSLGKNVVGYKMQSLVLGGLLGGLGGIMYALANSSVQPGAYSRDLSIFIFTAMILGGAGRVLGPIVGAILFSGSFVFLDNFLFEATKSGAISSSILDQNQLGIVRLFLTGIMLMALMVFRPQGIFGDRKELAIDAR